MACDAIKPGAVRLPATAHLYLLGLTERLKSANLEAGRHEEYRDIVVERSSRAEIHDALSRPLDACLACKMALVAYIVSKSRGEVPRVDDRSISGSIKSLGCAPVCYMKRAGPVTSFATDREYLKGRRSKLVNRLRNRPG